LAQHFTLIYKTIIMLFPQWGSF